MLFSGSSPLKGRETEVGAGDLDEMHLLRLLWDVSGLLRSGGGENEVL
jgi:hypothetical protein